MGSSGSPLAGHHGLRLQQLMEVLDTCPETPFPSWVYIALHASVWTLLGIAAAGIKDRGTFRKCVYLVLFLQICGAASVTLDPVDVQPLSGIVHVLRIFTTELQLEYHHCIRASFPLGFALQIAFSIALGLPMQIGIAIMRYRHLAEARRASYQSGSWAEKTDPHDNRPAKKTAPGRSGNRVVTMGTTRSIDLPTRIDEHYRDRHVNAVTVQATMVLYIVSYRALQTLFCGKEDGSTLHLVHSPDVQCGSIEHVSMAVFSGLVLVLFSACWVAFQLYWSRANPLRLEGDYRFLDRWGHLFGAFREGAKQWWMCDVFQLLGLASANVFLYNAHVWRLVLITPTFVIPMVAAGMKQPYTTLFHDIVHGVGGNFCKLALSICLLVTKDMGTEEPVVLAVNWALTALIALLVMLICVDLARSICARTGRSLEEKITIPLDLNREAIDYEKGLNSRGEFLCFVRTMFCMKTQRYNPRVAALKQGTRLNPALSIPIENIQKEYPTTPSFVCMADSSNGESSTDSYSDAAPEVTDESSDDQGNDQSEVRLECLKRGVPESKVVSDLRTERSFRSPRSASGLAAQGRNSALMSLTIDQMKNGLLNYEERAKAKNRRISHTRKTSSLSELRENDPVPKARASKEQRDSVVSLDIGSTLYRSDATDAGLGTASLHGPSRMSLNSLDSHPQSRISRRESGTSGRGSDYHSATGQLGMQRGSSTSIMSKTQSDVLNTAADHRALLGLGGSGPSGRVDDAPALPLTTSNLIRQTSQQELEEAFVSNVPGVATADLTADRAEIKSVIEDRMMRWGGEKSVSSGSLPPTHPGLTRSSARKGSDGALHSVPNLDYASQGKAPSDPDARAKKVLAIKKRFGTNAHGSSSRSMGPLRSSTQNRWSPEEDEFILKGDDGPSAPTYNRRRAQSFVDTAESRFDFAPGMVRTASQVAPKTRAQRLSLEAEVDNVLEFLSMDDSSPESARNDADNGDTIY